MIRVFKELFDSYAITVPLHKLSFTAHAKLMTNKLYWDNWGQFLDLDGEASLYRAVLGYDEWYDKSRNLEETEKLDYYLNRLSANGNYALKGFKVRLETVLQGVHWKDGVKPGLNRIYGQTRNTEAIKFKKGDKLLARINLLDKPEHVDLEWLGEVQHVATIPWTIFDRAFRFFEETRFNSREMFELSKRSKPKKPRKKKNTLR